MPGPRKVSERREIKQISVKKATLSTEDAPPRRRPEPIPMTG